MRAIAKSLVAFATGLIFCGAASAAVLHGSVSTPGDINLTSEGNVDWVHWGRNVATDVNRKVGGGSKISNYTLIGTGSTRARFNDSASTYSWTDGSPSASVSNTRTGVYINKYDGPGRGFQFTAPADEMERILDVFVGSWDASGTLEASLSDGSALPFTHTLDGAAGASVQGHYTLTYSAAAAGQSLLVRWIETADLGGADNVTLQAAALSVANVPEPGILGVMGVVGVFVVRRRK